MFYDSSWLGPSAIGTPAATGAAADALACPHHVRRALAYLRQHYAENVTLADLAAASGASERTLSRNFARFIGVSPHAFLRRLRLAAVRDELSRGDDAISRIAARHGFIHFGRFAITYRECFGEPPSATRRKARRERHGLIAGGRRGTSELPCLAVAACCPDDGGRETRLFAENLGEQLAASLGGASFLSVRLVPAGRDRFAADTASVHWKSSRPAGYLLTARVMPEDDLIRVVTRLVANDDGRQLWAETFDGSRKAVLAFQGRIVGTVAEAARSAIMHVEMQAAGSRPPDALDDHGLVLRALPLALLPDHAGRALEMLQRVMELYPGNGIAVALAAWCHAQSVAPWNDHADRDRTRALALAERAGVLDPNDPLVLTARAAVMTVAKDFAAAETLVQRALAHDPGCAWAWERRGWLKAVTRHSEAAIADFQQALRLVGPESDGASSLFGIGAAYWCHRDYDAAITWVDRASARRPAAPDILAQLAGCHIRLGDPLRGRAILDSMRRLRPGVTAKHIAESFWYDKPCPSVANVLAEAGLPH